MANNALNAPPAVVLLSGGLDSATTLAIARDQGFACHAIAFDYGQRHRAELDAPLRQAKALGAFSHRVVHVDMNQFGSSALTDFSIDVPEAHSQSGIPSTYVPARNTVMLSLALALADLGVNAVDYSGYPDCRPEYIAAFEQMANLATKAGVEGARFRVHAPPIAMSKAEIIRTGTELGVDYSLTVSCYQAHAGRQSLRPLRLVHPACRRFCGGRHCRPHALRYSLNSKAFVSVCAPSRSTGQRCAEIYVRFHESQRAHPAVPLAAQSHDLGAHARHPALYTARHRV
ncbi:MAG: 7-cyano-7-deazaguanine synthase [Fluviibacter phosphoraccumulans EoVTN8]